MDLKIPKALSNRVLNNGYSKHFRDMISGTKAFSRYDLGDKVEENDMFERKIFTQTHSNKAGKAY